MTWFQEQGDKLIQYKNKRRTNTKCYMEKTMNGKNEGICNTIYMYRINKRKHSYNLYLVRETDVSKDVGITTL